MKTLKIVPPVVVDTSVVLVSVSEFGEGKTFSRFSSLNNYFRWRRYSNLWYNNYYADKYYGLYFWLIDHCGDEIPKEEIFKAFDKYANDIRERVKARYYRYVPGTKRSNGGWYRTIRTMNEIRQYEVYKDECKQADIRPRSRRSKLPNSWDDEPYRCRQNTWKKHRKTQYKQK